MPSRRRFRKPTKERGYVFFATADAYVNHPDPTCPRCSLPKKTIKLRLNPYYVILEYDFAFDFKFVMCDDCEHQEYLET